MGRLANNLRTSCKLNGAILPRPNPPRFPTGPHLRHESIRSIGIKERQTLTRTRHAFSWLSKSRSQNSYVLHSDAIPTLGTLFRFEWSAVIQPGQRAIHLLGHRTGGVRCAPWAVSPVGPCVRKGVVICPGVIQRADPEVQVGGFGFAHYVKQR